VARAPWCRGFDHAGEAVSPIPWVSAVGDHPCCGRAGPRGTVDRTGLTGLIFELSCEAAVERAAGGSVGHRGVVDVAVGSREAVEPSRAIIEESRRCPE
jgi:hypothetical protein